MDTANSSINTYLENTKYWIKPLFKFSCNNINGYYFLLVYAVTYLGRGHCAMPSLGDHEHKKSETDSK